jgi:hypothetical protein
VNAGDAVYNYFDEQAKAMLKEHHEAEDELIAAAIDNLEWLNSAHHDARKPFIMQSAALLSSKTLFSTVAVDFGVR